MQTGWMVTVNSSTFAIIDVLSLDAGSNKLSYDKCSVQNFNEDLFFHLFVNNSATILGSLNGLISSNLITVTNYTHTKSEN